MNLDDPLKLGEEECVEQNTASVLFHEIGEMLTPRKKTRRGKVVVCENSARSAIGLPKRPYDYQHSTWCETKDKSYDQVKAENEEIKTKNEESKTKNED